MAGSLSSGVEETMAANGYYGQQSGDLRVTLAISQNEASYGTTRMLNLPDGRTIQVAIVPGTRPGQEIRLEGQGQQSTSGGPPGALILTISIMQAENFGSQPYPLGGSDTPTAFMAPPPPPIQPSYPGINQTSGGNVTNYPAQGQQASGSNYGNYPAQVPTGQTPVPPVYGNPPRVTQSMPQQYPPPGTYGLPGQMPVVPPVLNKTESRRPLIVTITLAALAALLVMGSLIYYAAVYQPQQQRMIANAKATAQVQSTHAAATAQVVGTAKAQTNATSTAVALPLIEYTTITAKTPDLLNDPLTAPSPSNWQTDKKCSFTGGKYHVVSDQKGFFYYCAATATKFSHFLYQVNMTLLKGNYGGIIFRADLTNSKFYLLRINGSNGEYDLYIYTGSQAKDSRTLLCGTSTVLNTGLNQSNKVAVLTRANKIALYFNGTYIDSVNDTTISSGEIAVFADDNQGTSEVAFDQAQVWSA